MWNATSHQREDTHSIAAVLKLFLRELPEPLFPSRYYSLAMKVIREITDPVHQSYNLRVCIYSLPKPNRDSILFIANFLHRVAFNHKDNEVDASTLAHIFAPYIFRPPGSINLEKVCIPADIEHAALLMKRLVEDAPFFFKTIPRPPGSPESIAAPSSSFIQGRALYPYPGGSKWLLPLQKDDVVTVLDIKNEDGWVKVARGAENGYAPLSYIQLVPLQPPADDPNLRVPIPAESDTAHGDAVHTQGNPPPPAQLVPPPHLTSPHLLPFSPHSKQFSSPDLSHIHTLPPPPPLVVFPLGTDASIPPPIDLSSIPAPDIPPPHLSPLSASAPQILPPPPLNTISPRGTLSNSVPSLPAFPSQVNIGSPSKSASFNNQVLPPPPSLDHPIIHPPVSIISSPFSLPSPFSPPSSLLFLHVSLLS